MTLTEVLMLLSLLAVVIQNTFFDHMECYTQQKEIAAPSPKAAAVSFS